MFYGIVAVVILAVVVPVVAVVVVLLCDVVVLIVVVGVVLVFVNFVLSVQVSLSSSLLLSLRGWTHTHKLCKHTIASCTPRKKCNHIE